MPITEIEVERYRRGGQEVAAEIVVVVVYSSDGHTGCGFLSSNERAGSICEAIIRQVLSPTLIGCDETLIDACWQSMYDAAPRRAGDGLVRQCIGALDFALWDIKAKRLGVPMAKLFGHYCERIPTYANCAHHMAPDALAERAAEYVARGHKALKIRGTRTFVSVDEATARLAAVREAVGPDIKLMVDVNGSWDVATAIAQLKRWERYDVYWLEEPVPPADIVGYQKVRERAGRTLIVGGEQHVGLMEFRALIDSNAVDIAQPNAAVTGGITDWLRIHAYCTARGVPVSPWDLQMVHLHLAAGLSNVMWIEYFMADNALLEFQSQLFARPRMREEVTAEGVFLLAPDGLGLGLELDPSVAEASRVCA